jgi:xylulokinase
VTGYLLAHDLGTSGNKAVLYTTEGKLVGSRVFSYNTRYFRGTWAEQDPADWWKAVCESTRALVKGIDTGSINCVSFSGQMMGCLCVDKQGTPLRNSILYCDQRATKETQSILSEIEPWEFYKITGHRAAAVYSIEKLMWIKNSEPDIYRKTYKMLNAKDYIVFKLTAKMMTDYTDASGTNAFDLTAKKWSAKLLAISKVDPDLLPEAVESIRVVGGITRKAAAETGLKAGTPVVIGAGDGVCATIGVGCIKPGIAYTYLGSSAWIGATTEQPVYDKKMRTMTWAHAVPGYVHPSGSMQAAGTCYNWLKNEICTLEVKEAKEKGISPYDMINQEIEASPAGANGVVFLPYLLGERSPHWNPNAKGSFIGITLTHRRQDILRAVLEGVSYNLNIILDIFKSHFSIADMIVIGGGAKGKVWLQMLADIYNLKVLKPNYLEEATSMGAAVIGGVGVGEFKDFRAIDRFIRIKYELSPNPANRKAYDKTYRIFQNSYQALIDIFEMFQTEAGSEI